MKRMTAIIVIIAALLSFSACAEVKQLLEGEQTTAPFVTSLSEQPKKGSDIAAYLDKIIDKSYADNVSMTRETLINIGQITLNGLDDPEMLSAAMDELKSIAAGALKSDSASYGPGEARGTDAPRSLGECDPASAECVIGEETDDETGETVLTDFYNGSITFDTENAPNVFRSINIDAVYDELQKMSGYLSVTDISPEFDNFRINFVSDRLNDEIDNCAYSYDGVLTLRLKGEGVLEQYGEFTADVVIHHTDVFTFDWSGEE